MKQKATLKCQVTRLAVQMQKAQSSGYRPTRGKSKNKTKRWLRELKQQQFTKCGSSLVWMESEGYTPLNVTVQNNKTGDTEIING